MARSHRLLCHSSISPSNTVSAGPVISTGASSPAHSIVSRPPRVSHVDPRVEPAEADAGDHRGAGAGAAGQRLAGAALVDAQPDRARARRTCMKPALTRRGKARRASRSAGPSVATGAVSTSATTLHRVRIAHRQHRDLDGAASPRSSGHSAKPPSVARREAGGVERHRAPGRRRARPCRPSRGRRPAGAARARCSGSRRDRGLVGQALVAHVAHEAARAVAALLDLVAAAPLKMR